MLELGAYTLRCRATVCALTAYCFIGVLYLEADVGVSVLGRCVHKSELDKGLRSWTGHRCLKTTSAGGSEVPNSVRRTCLQSTSCTSHSLYTDLQDGQCPAVRDYSIASSAKSRARRVEHAATNLCKTRNTLVLCLTERCTNFHHSFLPPKTQFEYRSFRADYINAVRSRFVVNAAVIKSECVPVPKSSIIANMRTNEAMHSAWVLLLVGGQLQAAAGTGESVRVVTRSRDHASFVTRRLDSPLASLSSSRHAPALDGIALARGRVDRFASPASHGRRIAAARDGT